MSAETDDLLVPRAPLAPGTMPAWTVAAARGALQQLELGQFSQAALMVDAMRRDPRIESCLNTLIHSLLGLNLSVLPEGEDPDERAVELAKYVEAKWHDMVPEAQLSDLLRWYVMTGVALGELRWRTDSGEWKPQLYTHHPRFVYHLQHQDEWHVITQNGDEVVQPGDGKWILLVDGRLGYMGAAVRSLTIPWLVRQFAQRDWNRHSEIHGIPTRLAKVPAQANEATKNKFLGQIRTLGAEATLMVPQYADGEGGFGLELIEAATSSWEVFDRLLASCNVDIALRLLGQNLTSEVQGGSYAAAGVHERILQGILRSLGQRVATELHHQLLYPFVELNYGKAARVPWPKWDTDPPEDLQKRALTIQTVLSALESAPSTAANINVRQLLEDFNLPLVDESELPGDPDSPMEPGTPMPPKAAGFCYHGHAHVVTLASGAPANQQQGFVEGREAVDAIADSGAELAAEQLAPDLAVVMDCVRTSESFDQLRHKLQTAFAHMSPDDLTDTYHKAILLTKLAGRWSVLQDANP